MKYFHPEAVTQRAAESIAYSFDAGATPSNLSATLYQVADDGTRSNATSGHLSGSASASGTVVTTPAVHDLEDGGLYLLEVVYTAGGNTYAPLLTIHGEA